MAFRLPLFYLHDLQFKQREHPEALTSSSKNTPTMLSKINLGAVPVVRTFHFFFFALPLPLPFFFLRPFRFFLDFAALRASSAAFFSASLASRIA